MSSPSRPNRETTPSDNATRELVFYCTVCFTPLAGSGRNSQDPSYWLTSCGHIVCSNHLFPDGVPPEATQKTHTCPHCQRPDISLAAVNGSEPPEGLRDYFTPQLELLENFTGALRFQYDNAIRAANHYKRLAEKLQAKLENQKSVLLRVRDELLEARELKKEKPLLDAEIARLKQDIERLRSSDGVIGDSRQQYSPAAARNSGGHEEAEVILDMQNQPASGQKRKSDRNSDDGARVRDFRRELNNRSTMPPPPPPSHLPVSKTPQDVRERELPQQQKQIPQQQEQPSFFQSYDKHPDAMNSNPAFQRPANPYTSSSSPARTFSNAPHLTQQFQQNSFIQPPQSFSSREKLSAPPSTPRHQQPFFNTPFRLPTRPETPTLRPSHQQQPESNVFSPSLPRPQLQKMISPTGNPGGRLSLAPQSSHGVNNNGGYMNTRITSITADRPGTSNPYFTRSHFERAKVAGPGTMFSRGGTESLDALREKMGSRLGTSQGVGLRFGIDGSGSRVLGTRGGGGLNELLTSGEGSVERLGLRRAVRRE